MTATRARRARLRPKAALAIYYPRKFSRHARIFWRVVDRRAKRVKGAEGRSARLRPKAALDAYTIVELMMAITVLAIGVSGVIAMQKVTIASNQHAKNLAVATGIAQAWADALAADASQWNTSSDLGDTAWLNPVTSNELVWIRPPWNAQRAFGPAFGPLGNSIQNNALAAYCTDIRLAWLHNSTLPQARPGSGLIRAEIRVFWRRPGAVTTTAPPVNICDTAANPPVGLNTAPGLSDAFHFVYLTTAIAQQPGGGA